MFQYNKIVEMHKITKKKLAGELHLPDCALSLLPNRALKISMLFKQAQYINQFRSQIQFIARDAIGSRHYIFVENHYCTAIMY